MSLGDWGGEIVDDLRVNRTDDLRVNQTWQFWGGKSYRRFEGKSDLAISGG